MQTGQQHLHPSAQPASGGAVPAATGTVVLPDDCTARNAAWIKEQLSAVLDLPQPVTIDLKAVERIDTAGLQLVTALVRDRERAGRAVTWQGRSDAFVEAATLLGLAPLLGFPAVR